MQKLVLFILFCLCLSSCKSTKHTKSASKTRTTKTTTKPTTTYHKSSSEANKIVNYAKQFQGVKYKYGGTTKKGMDCSGLVNTAYKSENILLPRTTGSLATHGDWIDLKDVQKGDLVFFATKKNSRSVNHVGIVTDTRTGYVEFIHASTSRGVMISSLAERYWYFAFVQARRVL